MRKGFSLLEMTLSAFLMGMAVALAFGLFSFGSRAFRLGSLRSGLQAEARRIYSQLDWDLRRTDMSTLSLVTSADDPMRQVPNVTGTLVERDGVCMAGLSDWRAAGSYDAATLRPRWDRYVVYFATTEATGGRLLRQVLTPSGAPFDSPYAALTLDPDVPGDVLAQHVDEFKVSRDATTDSIVVQLKLRERGGQKVGTAGKNLDETLELGFQVGPENTAR